MELEELAASARILPLIPPPVLSVMVLVPPSALTFPPTLNVLSSMVFAPPFLASISPLMLPASALVPLMVLVEPVPSAKMLALPDAWVVDSILALSFRVMVFCPPVVALINPVILAFPPRVRVLVEFAPSAVTFTRLPP